MGSKINLNMKPSSSIVNIIIIIVYFFIFFMTTNFGFLDHGQGYSYLVCQDSICIRNKGACMFHSHLLFT